MKKRLTAFILLAFLIIIMAFSLIPGSAGLFERSQSIADSSRQNADEAGISDTLVVVSPHPIRFISPLLQEFENETGINVDIISCGTGSAIEKITSDETIDVLWGGSILSVGPYSDSFYPYETPNRALFKPEYESLPATITCFSDIPSIIMVNEDIIGDIKIEGYADLLNPALKGKIAFADPSKSSSSFEHLVNMLYAMGAGAPEKGWDYTEKLISQLDNNLLNGSAEVYEGVANGDYIAGLTFEEAAVTMLKNDKHVRIIYMSEGVISTPDGIYINKDSGQLENAEKFADFLTSYDAQTVMAKTLGRRPIRSDVEASDMVIAYDEINSITADRDEVTINRDEWIAHFLELYDDNREDADE